VQDEQVPSDMINRQPPQDGEITSSGNPFALKLDGVTDELGNAWNKNDVRNDDATPLSIEFDTPPKIRRVVVYVTEANWDDSMPLARSSFDLHTPLYRWVYLSAPY